MSITDERIIKLGGIPFSQDEYDEIKKQAEAGNEEQIKKFEEIKELLAAWRARHGDGNVEENEGKDEEGKDGQSPKADENSSRLTPSEPSYDSSNDKLPEGFKEAIEDLPRGIHGVIPIFDRIPGGGNIETINFPNGKTVYCYQEKKGKKSHTLNPYIINAEEIKAKQGQEASDNYMKEALANEFGPEKAEQIHGTLNKVLNKDRGVSENTDQNSTQQTQGVVKINQGRGGKGMGD